MCAIHKLNIIINWDITTKMYVIICHMFTVQAHWLIPSHMTICNHEYFLPKTILTRHYYSILFSIMVLLLCHIVLLWHHIVPLFGRNVTHVLLWYLTSQYHVTIVAPWCWTICFNIVLPIWLLARNMLDYRWSCDW